jgi:hypothetical protein
MAKTLRTLLIGFEDPELQKLIAVFRLINSGVVASVRDAQILRAPDDLWGMFDSVLINQDVLAGQAAAMDDYLACRDQFPEKTFIIVSRKVVDDDLTTEHAALCDGMLRLPLSPSQLSRGLMMASQNHRRGLQAWPMVQRLPKQAGPELGVICA